MFVGHEVQLDVPYLAARAGLTGLTGEGWLTDASGDAYSEGLAGLIRVGPFGDIFGASKLVRVLLLEPVERDGCLVLMLRWEATGVMGRLFPVLDANITLAPAGPGTSRLVLAGAYRPPLAGVGDRLDRALLHRAATATVRALLQMIAGTIESGYLASGEWNRPVRAPVTAASRPAPGLAAPHPDAGPLS